MPKPSEILYSTTELIESFRDVPVADTFLNRTFFGDERFFDGKFCQVDFKQGRRLLAPLIKRGQLGRVLERPPIRTSFFDVPTIAPMRPLTVADLDDRLSGETVYDRRPAGERMAEVLADDYLECREAIVRRIEWMTSQLLFKGSITYLLDDGTTDTLEYGTPSEVTPALTWDDADADPFKDLSDAADAIQGESGAVADIIVFGADVLGVFLWNEKVQRWLNMLNFRVMQVEPREGIGTAQHLGNCNRPYAAMYSYAEATEQETLAVGLRSWCLCSRVIAF